MINQKSLFKTILSLAVLGIYSLGKPQTTIAEPAPIFQPIIEEIRNKLPSNLVFRLPSRLPEVVTREMSPKLTFDVNSERAYLALEDENCPSRFSGGGRGSRGYGLVCLRFSVTSSTLTSIYYQQNRQRRDLSSGATVIELSNNVRGYHFPGAGWSSVSWVQDNIYFSIYSGSASARDLIEVARLMVASNPIPNADQYANNKENLVAINLGCTRDLKTILGQNAPDYCRSAEGDSGILFDEIKDERQTDKSIKVEIRVFNRGSADGLIEIYDSNNHLVDIKIIERNEVPAGLVQSGYDMFTKVPASFFSRYPIGDTRQNLKEQKINLIIPYRGYIKITKSSPLAYWYNAGLFVIEASTFDTDNPEFTKSETAKKFLIGFAKESANKGIINIFKGEPSIQAVFSLDFVDKNKLAEVMQKLLVYSQTVDREDPSKNPLIGGFKDVSIDSLNMGLENLLDKSPLPGLGTVVRGTRLTATSFNIFARASDLHYSQTLGEKATITLQDSVR